ncbi:MAG: transcription-repair coupling factor, partial [Microthrixaceae bacterium]
MPDGAPLAPLLPALRDLPGLGDATSEGRSSLAVPSLAQASVIAAAVDLRGGAPLVVAVPMSGEAERLAADLSQFLPDGSVALFPAWETLPFERVSPGIETMGARVETLWRLRTGDPSLSVVVAPARALVQRLGPHVEDTEPIPVERGSILYSEELVEALVAMGYHREYQVEHRGEVAVRGSIVDVFPATADHPVRIDLWGDEVDRLAHFSVSDQLVTDDVDSVRLFPARELLPSPEVRQRAEALVASEPWGREQWERIADGEIFDGMEAWSAWLADREHVLYDLVAKDSLIVTVDPRRVRDRAADIIAEEESLAESLSRTWDLTAGGDLPHTHLPFERLLAHTEADHLTLVSVPDNPDTIAVDARGWPTAIGDAEAVLADISELLQRGSRVVVCADGKPSADRLSRVLTERGLAFQRLDPGARDMAEPGGWIVESSLDSGCVFPTLGLGLLSEADLTGRRRTHRPQRRRRRDAQQFFEDLTVGGYVVHETHGVARFAGMVTRSMGGAERDYLLLEYRGEDRLYVPSDQVESVRLYSGGDTPRLNKMGGADFARTKAKVRSAVSEIAQELVLLYQQRLHAEGHAFAPDTPWQTEMEASFAFQETPDQARAILDVKADMEADVPMDRLVCGDVGFGKTEVAVRAAFKAIQDGRQAAVLVPTTLLAQQHHQTFSERFAGYPVRVEVLSRFLTDAQARKVTDGLRDGSVDLVIGTHRLLSKDIEFKALGLLVVDEEQRFGVSHKESIKALKADVDVLTLTATPIPRTLEMSLTGIRDLSVLNTPPADRQPILTYVGEYDERPVAEAIRRELLREGQVFFVHNRVQSIEKVANDLRNLVPEARVAIAHGQMDEGSLEKVVLDFWEGQYDVLVCTTIIESGIDMPTVNTLVVDRAELLGLGQLHQLRGRVGRSGQRAYAYLFTRPDAALTEDAYERLRTIGEATELGAGFKIAMRDLEIRGAGNLLGTGQSGHIAAVGYDLYCQLVTEAVAELNGTPVAKPVEIKLDLPVDANLPEDY